MKNIKTLELVEELKKGHSLVIETLKQARKLGIDTKEGQNEILSAKDTILGHMKKENEEFYPVLRKAAESNGKLKELIAEFDNDINEISHYSSALAYSKIIPNSDSQTANKILDYLKKWLVRHFQETDNKSIEYFYNYSEVI